MHNSWRRVSQHEESCRVPKRKFRLKIEQHLIKQQDPAYEQSIPVKSKLHITQMGVKRPHAAMDEQESTTGSSPIMSMFEGFRAELDEHHDRRERIIKASRDITASSKKM